MLLHNCTTVWRWLAERSQAWHSLLPRTCPPQAAESWSLQERPPLNELAVLPHHQLPSFVQASTIACHYLEWLGALDWTHFPERSRCHDNGLHFRGPAPERAAPYVAALLVKVDRQLPHMADLRQCLVDHPALPWLFGFPLQASERWTWGFDVDASLPSHRHFNRILRTLPNESLQFLLTSSIRLLEQLLPPDTLLGDTISLDTKHIIAWVKENNPKVFIKGGRYHKERQPKGDPDCKLGFKAQSNQKSILTPTTTATAASHVRIGDYYWGYASGLVATKVPHWGEVVLAEKTLPFDHGELSFFLPLMRQVEARLGRRPRFGALDAAFDAFYVYAYFHHANGFAAVPLRQAEAVRSFNPVGLPLCPAGLPMPLKSTYLDRTHLLHHRRGRYACPLCFPAATDLPCPLAHPKRDKGGCLTTLPTSCGTRIRTQLDRQGQAFRQLYRQRTATERIFSQALELGIERPKLRNGVSIANLNTLVYLTLNLRTQQRIRRQQSLPMA